MSFLLKNIKNLFLAAILASILATAFQACHIPDSTKIMEVAPGVLKISNGEADRFSPYSFCQEKPLIEAMRELPQNNLPFSIDSIRIVKNERGCILSIPLSDDEQLYGFGMQVNSFTQRGLKRRPIVNDIPLNDLGYTHGPVPMYVSTKGYAILVNTSRYTTFYCGTHRSDKASPVIQKEHSEGNAPALSTEELYKNKETNNQVIVDIPNAKGVEVFVFTGTNMKNAIQRYNLFSGGGAMPALWGMGIKYRLKADSGEKEVINTANYFRENKIPCDVFGLEPKWQTAAYSCSYVWNPETFPSPQRLIDSLKNMNLKVNLWEHAFVHPTSPIYSELLTKSGDYPVWNGLVPDFVDPEAKAIFSDYHEKTFISQGISGFKLDECDNSNLARGRSVWSFPELSQFPSGIDGEQMHQVFGVLYAQSINDIYRKNNLRTYLDYRASNAFASSLPAALYSDTYDHKEYIRMIVNAGFSGLLWSPEVRESNSETELIRRIQTVVLSAQALVNSWYLKNPPWMQYDTNKNNDDIFLDNAKELENIIRTQFNYRMSLIPYLYSAFANYRFKGIPPFRALVVDYPSDKNVENIYNEYLIGESILAAPLIGESDTREVYLPMGVWYNFNTNEKYKGGKTYTIRTSFSELPIFIKEGTILPLAKPVEFVDTSHPFELSCRVYGETAGSISLFEDDGNSYDFEDGEFNWLEISWTGNEGMTKRTGDYKGRLYEIINWESIK